jgi:hypothetical protein
MRMKLTWKQHNGIYRYVVLTGPLHFATALRESLAKAPGVVWTHVRPLEKGEHVKGPDWPGGPPL